MPFSFRKLTKTHFIALLSLVLLAAIVFAVGKHSYLTPASSPASLAGSPAKQIAPRTNEATNTPQGVIQLLLRPEGFDSPTFTVAKGTYILILLNRTGKENLTLEVSRVTGNGEKLKDIKFDSKKKYQAIDSVDLTPGDYVVSVQSHPEWVSRITATNK